MGKITKCFIKRGEACLEMVDKNHWTGKECIPKNGIWKVKKLRIDNGMGKYTEKRFEGTYLCLLPNGLYFLCKARGMSWK